MKRLSPLACLACLALACEQDPARSVKIGDQRPAATEYTVTSSAASPPRATPGPGAAAAGGTPQRQPPGEPGGQTSAATGALPPAPADIADWRPAGCPPPSEEATGPGRLIVSGPCAFEHQAAVSCEILPDDLIIAVTRKGARGSTVMVYLNVEKYTGPGTYDEAQMFVGVQDATTISRWSSDMVALTVGKNGDFVELPATRLEAEPMLLQCSGPMTNFQCEARDSLDAMEKTVETVSGTLYCAEKKYLDDGR